MAELQCLAAKAVEGAALALEGVDDVKGCHSLPAGVLSVCDSITDDILQKHLENTTSLLVDEATDALHASTASQTPDGGLGDACADRAASISSPYCVLSNKCPSFLAILTIHTFLLCCKIT